EAGGGGGGGKGGGGGALGEGGPLSPASAIDDAPRFDIELFGFCLQDRRGAGEHVGPRRLAGLPGGSPADAGSAGGPGAAAIGRMVGVAGDDAHPFDRHAE